MATQIVTATYTDLQDYTYYFVPAPWLSVKLLRLLQNYPPPDDPAVKARILECLETILNKAQEPPKSKKVQHSNAKNAVLFEVGLHHCSPAMLGARLGVVKAISYIIHMDTEPAYLVRACNQLGQFLTHKETNLRYLALESMCLLATSEFSHDAVRKHQETIINALKVNLWNVCLYAVCVSVITRVFVFVHCVEPWLYWYMINYTVLYHCPQNSACRKYIDGTQLIIELFDLLSLIHFLLSQLSRNICFLTKPYSFATFHGNIAVYDHFKVIIQISNIAVVY